MRGSARIADEAGFTLVELLVTMVVGLIVVGGGVYGLARAFHVTNASSARVTASSNTEVGLERLVVDLRDAVNGSCSFRSTSVSGVNVALSGAITTLTFCDPNTNQASNTNVPPSEGVQWQCNTATSGTAALPAETCARTIDVGTLAAPSILNNTRIVGVQTLGLRGVLNSVTPAVYLPCGSSTACTATASATYSLNPGSATSLSWIGVVAAVGQNSAPGAGEIATVNASAPLTFSTGAALLNFGTS